MIKKSTIFDYLEPPDSAAWWAMLIVYAIYLVPILGVLSAFSLIVLPDYQNATPRPRGCKKLGLETKTNLADEHTAKGKKDSEEKDTKCTVKSLWIYPIKSCRGVELGQGTVVATGMEYDRQFCFAQLKSPFPVSASTSNSEKSAHTWEFMTQRQFPLLAQVQTEIWVPNPAAAAYSPSLPFVQSGGAIVLKFPYQEDGIKGFLQRIACFIIGEVPCKVLTIPYNPTAEQIRAAGFESENLKIWKDTPKAVNMGSLLPLELKYFLGVRNPLSLFRVATEHPREVYRNAPRKAKLGYQPVVGFADAYPLHILNLASVQDVGSKLIDKTAPKLSVLQFRANIIVTGPAAYEEDAWKRVRIGKYLYHVSCRTARCKMPNTDQISGVKHPTEPDATLRSFRRIDAGAKYDACLGMQMVAAEEKSEIRVGDAVEVLETGEHLYIVQ